MTTDLSERHSPFTDHSSDAVCRLTDEQLAHYAEHGYVAGVRILDEAGVVRLRDELRAFVEPEHDGHELWYEYHTNESGDPDNVLFHALGAWRIAPGFHDLLWHPAFVGPAEQLLGGPVRFWHDQLFCKPARHGGVVAWHQDYSYWTATAPMNHLTCWIALDDSTAENGCLQYVPGSHRWDLLPITGLAGNMEAIREVLSDEQWKRFREPVPVPLRAGEAAFHHPLLVHGSRQNRTDAPRRATVINAFLDGTRSTTDDMILDRTEVIPAGESMGGRFFPLLSLD